MNRPTRPAGRGRIVSSGALTVLALLITGCAPPTRTAPIHTLVVVLDCPGKGPLRNLSFAWTYGAARAALPGKGDILAIYRTAGGVRRVADGIHGPGSALAAYAPLKVASDLPCGAPVPRLAETLEILEERIREAPGPVTIAMDSDGVVGDETPRITTAARRLAGAPQFRKLILVHGLFMADRGVSLARTRAALSALGTRLVLTTALDLIETRGWSDSIFGVEHQDTPPADPWKRLTNRST